MSIFVIRKWFYSKISKKTLTVTIDKKADDFSLSPIPINTQIMSNPAWTAVSKRLISEKRTLQIEVKKYYVHAFFYWVLSQFVI